MQTVSNANLIQQAAAVLNPVKLTDDMYVGDVACALIAESGETFTGAAIGGYLGLCAEQSAASNMVSHTQPRIIKMVAVWRNENGELFVLPPCGRCREFLCLLSQNNLETDVILGKEHTVKLKDLLPLNGWHAEKAT